MNARASGDGQRICRHVSQKLIDDLAAQGEGSPPSLS